MTLNEVEREFGSLYKACMALGLTEGNIYYWRKKNYIPHRLQWLLQEMTEGRLTVSAHPKKDVIVSKIRKKNKEK